MLLLALVVGGMKVLEVSSSSHTLSRSTGVLKFEHTTRSSFYSVVSFMLLVFLLLAGSCPLLRRWAAPR
jgi:hypothetical protein